ncbi:MAG: adenylate/guanylate cyclase domain-containing protein [Chloroflexota bacterium]|nr:adenylate/guanylate cyclase domain-containing protein [Chloroflexota bacterium]
MPELLTGTVTFLFSDIEGSTRLLRSQGDRWPSILARHQELLRAAFVVQGGVEIGTEGDSFFVVFPTAPGGVAAAVAAQRALDAEAWPTDVAVRVRMGLHTGEASLGTDGYVGLHVHRASRIANLAHGGQVLLSDTTRALVVRGLPEEIELRDLGQHRLRDIEHPEHLWQLVIPDLPGDFPPIASLDAVSNNLPTRLTTFLGREREIGEISELLERSRLLTLTGPGGTGKTRLSLEVARRSMTNYRDGVFFVELAPLTEPDLVPATIAQTLGLPDRGGRSAVDRLVDHIGEQHMLLVLDNFEQVTDAAISVNVLLAACPRLRVLASSRSILHVSGEQEYSVPPLGLPDPAHLPPLTQLSQYEAVALFIERARAVKSDFEITNENAPAVAEICVRLDGLPLAIELAAARLRIFTPQAMLDRLDHRFGLLAGGARDLPERQQTLRGAIAWSHDMLDEPERALFASLAVFVGGAGLEAIERTCGDEVDGDLLDILTSLVEKSLVRQTEGIAGGPRFGMLETIREFAMEQAVQRAVWPALRARHAEFFTDLVERSAVEIMGSAKREWLDRLEQDHDNLRAALSWTVETRTAEMGMRLGSTIWRFWQMRGYLPEGLERLEQVLGLEESTRYPERRAEALSAAAGIAYWLADNDRSRQRYAEEIEARRTLGDRHGLAEALYGISFTWSIKGLIVPSEAELAAAYVNEAREIFRDIGDDAGVGRCDWALANIAWGIGRLDESHLHAIDALTVFEAVDDRFMVGWVTYTLALEELSRDLLAGGDPERRREAHRWLRQSLEIFAEAQDVSGYTLVLDAVAVVALRDGQRKRAAILSAAVIGLERVSGTRLNLWNRDVLGFDPGELRSDPELAEAWAAGEAMSAAEAVAYALEDDSAQAQAGAARSRRGNTTKA